MPVGSSIQVSLSEVLQVRGGPLQEEELWSILCQSCKAIQDTFIQGRAIASDGPSFVVSPYTVLFSPSGTVQFAESIDITLPNIANYLPPEGIGRQTAFSNAAVEKMYIFALGKSLLWASDYMRVPYSSAVLGHTLKNLFTIMADNNPLTRPAVMQILEFCTIHAQSLGYGMPYAQHIIQLSKIVLGSIFALDQLGDSFNSNTNNSVSTATRSPRPRSRSPEPRRSGRVSPGKRNHQQLNSSDSIDAKRNRKSQDYDETDRGRSSSHKSRRRGGYSNLSSSTVDSRDSYEDVRSRHDSRSPSRSRERLDDRSSHRDASRKSNQSDGRSYHMSDIFSPQHEKSSKSNHYKPLSEKNGHSSKKSESRYSKAHSVSSRGYESMPDRPSSRSKQRSPPLRSKTLRTNVVYERLRERRERLGRLREQLGLRPRNQKELNSVSDYDSETETVSEDENLYRGQRPEVRSYKSLTSVESARQGSYHPDQYSQYSSAVSLNLNQRSRTSSPQRQAQSVLDVHQRNGYEQHDGGLERRLQASSPSIDIHKKNTLPSRRKLKKFFGPEFVVMSSEPNESITMPLSFLSKAGRIPPEKKRVTAVLLNGRRLDLLSDLGTTGQELFDLIASHVGLSERPFFGLAYIRDGEYLFIDADSKLYKVGPDSWRDEVKKGSKKVGTKEKFTVFFRVKYYLDNVSLLRDQVTRHQYYLQLRRDILEERTKCDERAALQLAALALQAEMGDHDASASRNYFLPEHYVAADMLETVGVRNIRERLPSMHESQKGLSDVEAELEFLMEARKLPEYGIHFHRVTQSKKEIGRGVWLGVCTRGIIVYEKRGNNRKQVHAHPWNKTKKIAFNRRKFVVEPYDETGMKFVHFTESYKKGRYLLQLCKSQHRFHMAMRTRSSLGRQFNADYPMDVDGYSAMSGSTRYLTDYEPNDDYSDGEPSMLGSMPSMVGASSYTLDSMRHRGPEVKRPTSGYEEVRVGMRPPNSRDKTPERHAHTAQQNGHTHQPPYGEHPGNSRSNARGQRPVRERVPQDDYDGGGYARVNGDSGGYARVNGDAGGYERVNGNHQRSAEVNEGSRQGSREMLEEPPYATIDSIKENKQRNKRNKREAEMRKEENGYAEVKLRVPEQAYVIDTSLRPANQTSSHLSLNQDESISDSLRERLEDLPQPEQPERDIVIVTLKKDSHTGLGLAIVGGENSRSLDLGIFVRSIEPRGPAHRDGRLHVGDRIISINGQSLEGVGHRVAVEIIRSAPEVVQLIVSQPKSATSSGLHSNLSRSTEMVHANVHQPVHTTPMKTPNIQLQGSLENVDDIVNDSSATSASDGTPRLRQKLFPPTKPRRRPESFGSTYSLNSDLERQRSKVEVKQHGKYLAVEKPPAITPRKGREEEKENDEEEQDGKITEREDDISKQTTEDMHSKMTDRDDAASADILDDHSQDDWEDLENDDDDDKDSNVTTPESSDMEDLFGDLDGKKKKPSMIMSKSLANVDSPPMTTTTTTSTAMSPLSENAMSPTTMESEAEKTEREKLDEEVEEASEGLELQPGDKYTVILKKANGSLGISVTGGVNTSVKHGGIYIKTMVAGGAADQDGRIKSGDRLLEVNGASLTHVTHKQAVEILRRAKDQSTLVIERGIPPAATSALPPTPVHFQQGGGVETPVSAVDSQKGGGAGEMATPTPVDALAVVEGGASKEIGATVSERTDTTERQEMTSDDALLQPADSGPSDFGTDDENLSFGSASGEDLLMDDEIDAISRSEPLTREEPVVVKAPSALQHAAPPKVAPAAGQSRRLLVPLPEITVEGDCDDTEPPNSPSSDEGALSPTDLHRMDSPSYHVAQRKNSLGILFHHDMESTARLFKMRSPSVSLPLHSESDMRESDMRESDEGSSLILPSIRSHATTPTIEAFRDDESFGTPPLSDDDYRSDDDMEPVPEEDEEDNEEEGWVSDGARTESPYASEGYSDEIDDYLAEIASPTLSTREADTLTPTAHLTGMRKNAKRKSWISVASSHSPAPTQSTDFGHTASSPRSSRRSPTSSYHGQHSDTAGSESEESGSVSFSDDDIVGHWSDNDEEHQVVRSKLPVESTPKDPNTKPRFEIQSPTSPSLTSESAQPSTQIERQYGQSPTEPLSDLAPSPASSMMSDAPPIPPSSPPHSSRSVTPSQASQISRTSPAPSLPRDEEPMSPNSTLSSVGALTLTQTMLSQTMLSTGAMSDIDVPILPFVTPENTFEVELNKDTQGLGFSVMGGRGSHADPRKCLIRIKKLFPGQAAARSGLVEQSDVILAVNGQMVHDATHPETVAKLRGAQHTVKLLLCRPSDEDLDKLTKEEAPRSRSESTMTPVTPQAPDANTSQTSVLSTPFSSPPLSPLDSSIPLLSKTAAPLPTDSKKTPPTPPALPATSPPPSATEDEEEADKEGKDGDSIQSQASGSLPKLSKVDTKSRIPVSSKNKSQDPGAKIKPIMSPSPDIPTSDQEETFEVHLVKPARGGLGFTVAGGANTGGCYIKDVLQEPATSDGRLRKGDKILEVNGRSMKGMSHFDAVSFLRMTPREVSLKVAHPSAASVMATPSPTRSLTNTSLTASPMAVEEKIAPRIEIGVRSKIPTLTGNNRTDDDKAVDTNHLPTSPRDDTEKSGTESLPTTPKTEPKNEKQGLDGDKMEDLPAVEIAKNERGQLGLLVELSKEPGGGLVVKEVVGGLPVARDGSIQPGDQIHYINEEPMRGISIQRATGLLARVPSIVRLKATRNNIPVKQRHQTPISPTSDRTESADNDVNSTQEEEDDDDWMSDSSEPVVESDTPKAPPPKLVSDQSSGEEKSKSSLMVPGFDLELGSVSEDSNWEDLSVSEASQEEPSRLDEVGDIMKDLEKHHGNYTPRSHDEAPTSPTRSVTSPLAIKVPTSPTSSLSSPPLSPLSPKTLPSLRPLPSLTEATTPSLPSNEDSLIVEDDDDVDDDAFTPGTSPRMDVSSPEKGDSSPHRSRHDSIGNELENELDNELSHLPPLPQGGIRSPLHNFKRQLSRDSPIGSEISTSVRIGTPTGRPPSAQGSEGGNLSIGEGGIVWIELEKPEGGGLGFSVVGAEKGGKTSIFIKTVTQDGVAGRDGRLKVGDRLLQVNGQSLVGMTQNKVITILRKSRGVVRLAVTGQLSRPGSLIGTDTERHHSSDINDHVTDIHREAGSDADLSPAQSYTESARDAGYRLPPEDDFEPDDDDDLPGSVTFDSSLSFTLPFSTAGFPPTSRTFGITPPPPEFREGFTEQDTDSDLDSTADLPNDLDDLRIPDDEGPKQMSASLLAAHKVGRALQNRQHAKQDSDDDSLSWGTNNSLPLDDDDPSHNLSSAAAGGGRSGAAGTLSSHMMLDGVRDSDLKALAIVQPPEGGRYAGKALRGVVARVQKQMDKQDPAEEFKTLRQVKAVDNCEEAKKARNKDKNRFRNVLPYDKTRVLLEDSGPSDYINASHVEVPVGRDTYSYIACQGPLPNTTQDFWLMVWEQKADIIAMVTLDAEHGKVKCHHYWPDSADSPLTVYGRIEVRLESHQVLNNFIIRKIMMVDKEKSEIRHVTHLNFTTWPDHSVPASAMPLLQFTGYMRHIHDNRLPIVVHCSAGIGRTGTLITIDIMLGLIDRDEEFKIVSIVKNLRKQRQGMIQTKDQYIFCYKAALEALKSVM